MSSFERALKESLNAVWEEAQYHRLGPRGPRPELDYSSWRSYAQSIQAQNWFDESELMGERRELLAEIERLRGGL